MERSNYHRGSARGGGGRGGRQGGGGGGRGRGAQDQHDYHRQYQRGGRGGWGRGPAYQPPGPQWSPRPFQPQGGSYRPQPHPPAGQGMVATRPETGGGGRGAWGRSGPVPPPEPRPERGRMYHDVVTVMSPPGSAVSLSSSITSASLPNASSADCFKLHPKLEDVMFFV